jgi:hypothetical protein
LMTNRGPAFVGYSLKPASPACLFVRFNGRQGCQRMLQWRS